MKPPSTVRYNEQKQLVASLEQQAQQLQRDAAGLQEQNEVLMQRQAFVHAWCEGMAALQRYSGGQRSAAAADGSCGQAAGVTEGARVLLQQLQDAEGSLLQQLSPANSSATATRSTASSSTPSSSHAWPPALADCCGPDVDAATTAPESDPCAIFLRALSRPPRAELYGMSLQRLGHFVRDVTLEMSMCLHQLEGSAAAGARGTLSAEQHADILARLRLLWQLFGQTTMGCVVVGHGDVVHAINTLNLSTLAVDAAGASAHDARVSQLVPALRLSPDQLRRISAGVAVFKTLLGPILHERASLQAEAAADSLRQLSIAGAASGSSGGSSSAGGGSSGSGAGADGAAAAAAGTGTAAASNTTASGAAPTDGVGMARHPIGHRQERLQAERARVIRLQQLMQKEYTLRTLGAAWFTGCLTLRQATRAAVLSWPWFWRPNLLAAEVAKYHSEQQTGQAQQQQAQQQQA